MPHRRWTVPLACLALVAPAHPPPATAATAVPAPAGATYQLTLLTGDRVRVTTRPGHPDQVTFVPHPGSGSDAAVTTSSGGRTFVVPSAAQPGINAGRLDRSLFDITTLIAQRYDDRRSGLLPLIVEYAGSPAVAQRRAETAALAGRTLRSIGARAATIRKSAATTFWAGLRRDPTIERISLDDRVTAALDHSVPQIGAPAAWQRGLTGKGVKIAILDTGVDASHPDLAGRVTSANFSEAPDAGDHDGHGTHVASTAAGTGAASAGEYKGVAPEATILSAKVLDDSGNGSESGIIAGMEWAAAQGAAVANLSLGSFEPSDGTDPVSQALNRLTEQTGTLYVVAAGNCQAPQPQSITSPGAAAGALTVGSNGRDGSLSGFSCRGPRKGDRALKPDLTAPGEDIVAARATGTAAGDPVDEHYTSLSGTSMATPHVTGTAALLAQAQPSWTADRLKSRLVSAADSQPGSGVFEQGAGRLDADQATDGSVTVDAAGLDLGTLRWPFPADDAARRTLTYRNPGPDPVTLQLATTMDQGAPAPQLSATDLVVPAGGEGSVTVTVDRGQAGPGSFAGRITATAAGADPLVTDVGWYAEPESYDLTIQGIHRDGAPADADLAVLRVDGPPAELDGGGVPLRDGQAVVRLPAGTYDLAGMFQLRQTDDRREQWTAVSSGDVQLRADRTVSLDARRGAAVDLAVRGSGDVNPRQRSMALARVADQDLGQSRVGLSITGAPRDLFAVPTSKTTLGSAEFSAGARLEAPPYRAAVVGGPAIAVHDFHFGPRFTGTMTLAVANAGTAQPAELTDVRGKLALIRRTEGVSPGNQAFAAQQAGARAALFYDPDAAGDSAVAPFWSYDGQVLDVTIPAMRTGRRTAAELQPGAKVRITGIATTPFSYDLLVPWDRVPGNPRQTFARSDFASFDESFGSHRQSALIQETRTGWTPAGSPFGGWLVPVVAAPYRRTSYVLANDVFWSSGPLMQDEGGESFSFGSPLRRYRSGPDKPVRWFTPIAAPMLPGAADITERGIRRVDGGLAVGFFPFGHGPDQYGDSSGLDELAVSVERAGEPVGGATLPIAWFDVPARAGAYRVTAEVKRSTPAWRYSTATHTVWEFRSTGAEEETMPVLTADLDVPAADLRNQVRTGRPVAITVGLRHQAGSTAAAITSAGLEISYDGKSWARLPLHSTGDRTYRATVRHPAEHAGGAPSIRVTATDAAGGKLTQEVTRAFGLVR